MTVQTETRVAGPFAGDDVVVSLPFDFVVFEAADLIVISRDDTTGDDTVLALTTDYSVAINADQDTDPGGTITLVAALATGKTAFAYSSVAALQEAIFTNTGGFYPSVLNTALDKLTILVQQIKEAQARSVLAPVGETAGLDLPPTPQRAGLYLAFDASGNLVASVGTADGGFREDAAQPGGSALLGFVQAGTGAVSRTAQAKLREVVSVTDFMGVLTTTAAIQAALDTGKHVYFPGGAYAITGPVTTSAAGQRIFGDGEASIITNSGTNANANAIVLAHAGCKVENLEITPGTTVASLTQGWGIYISAARCQVSKVRVTGHRRGGVIVVDANYASVSNCMFDSSVVAAADPQSDGGYDVFFYGTSSFCEAFGNHCISGCGVGVGCQTTAAAGNSQYGNIVNGNIITGHPSYGIMGYLGSTGTVAGMVITGNLIDSISGTTYSNGTQLFYGAGIYLQSVDDFTVSGNTITRTNTDRSLPRTGNDVPAAIGITPNDRCTGTVTGNTVRDAYYGIYAVGVNVTAGDGLTITGNRIKPDPSGTRKLIGGIVVTNVRSAVVSSNSILGSNTTDTVRGVWINNASGVTMEDFVVTGNTINTVNTGVEVSVISGSILSLIAKGNQVRNTNNYAIYSVAVRSQVEGNAIATAASGILLTAAVTQGHILNNNFVSTTTPITDSSTGGAQRSGNRYGTGSIQGTAVLVAGTVTVNTTEVLTGDIVLLNRTTAGGTLGDLSVGTITNATSFVINSNNAADTSTVAWEIRH